MSGIVLVGSFLSIIGVIIGHWITDKIQLFANDTHFFLTATSLIGFISLMGISARSSLLLIDFSKSLMSNEGMEKRRAIAIATATRAKPIMLTAIAIILGSLLLATDPIFGGLGVALIFGSIAATLVSLFFIPILMDNTKALKAEGNRNPKWCVLTENIKSLFPSRLQRQEYKPLHVPHVDDVPQKERKSTWCILLDNLKSYFPNKTDKDTDIKKETSDKNTKVSTEKKSKKNDGSKK